MQQPFGTWLVVIAGAVAIGIAVKQIHFAYREEFMRQLRLREMSTNELLWAERAGKFGHISLGIVSGVIGILLIVAAVRNDPNEAQDLDGALDTLARQPYGPYLLGGVALGFVAYGTYVFLEARYRTLRLKP